MHSNFNENMTETQLKIKKLDQRLVAVLRPWFKDREEFYHFFYHLIQNEHLIEMEKPENYEEKLKAVQFYRRLAVKRVVAEDTAFEELIDDIFSDYHEAYANFQENKQPLAQKRFLEILNKLMK